MENSLVHYFLSKGGKENWEKGNPFLISPRHPLRRKCIPVIRLRCPEVPGRAVGRLRTELGMPTFCLHVKPFLDRPLDYKSPCSVLLMIVSTLFSTGFDTFKTLIKYLLNK